MYSLILTGGTVVDGTGRPGFRADVGILDDRIVALSDLSDAEAAERLDVGGLAVCPGFIDMHSHSDLTLMVDGRGLSKIHQGVTTEVTGNCGSSPAPLTDEGAGDVARLFGHAGAAVAALPWDWRRFGDYLGRLESGGLGINVVPLAGHSALRTVGMGFERRPPTDAELDRMSRLLGEALEDGAWGMSTGLIYPPSVYADTDELVALAEVAAAHGGFYFSHIRGEGASLIQAVGEASRSANGPACPSRSLTTRPAGAPTGDGPASRLQLIEWANERGLDVAFDVYPYVAGSSSLTSVIPAWAHEGGRPAAARAPARPGGPRTAEGRGTKHVARIRSDADRAGADAGEPRLRRLDGGPNRRAAGPRPIRDGLRPADRGGWQRRGDLLQHRRGRRATGAEPPRP